MLQNKQPGINRAFGRVQFWIMNESPTKTQRPQNSLNKVNFLSVLSAFVGNKIEADTLLSYHTLK